MDNKSKANEAVESFKTSFNCAQSVLSTYCEDFGLDRETALRLSHGMGAGMGRLGNVCGAVSSAFLLLGLKYGSSVPNDKETKEKIYALVHEFAEKFEARNNTVLCKELLGVDLLTGDRSVIAEKVKSVCPKMILDAAEIIEEMLR